MQRRSRSSLRNQRDFRHVVAGGACSSGEGIGRIFGDSAQHAVVLEIELLSSQRNTAATHTRECTITTKSVSVAPPPQFRLPQHPKHRALARQRQHFLHQRHQKSPGLLQHRVMRTPLERDESLVRRAQRREIVAR
jgi:hypothetical protein